MACHFSTMRKRRPRALLFFLYTTAALARCSLCFSPTAPLMQPTSTSTLRHCVSVIPKLTPYSTCEQQLCKASMSTRRRGIGLNMAFIVPGTGVGMAAVAGAITGGVFAGGLHAISGPDHLAALLPKCCGQRWYKAGRIGVLWGLGHGISATLLGVGAFILKTQIQSSLKSRHWIIHGATSAMEIAVGASLVVVGLLGIREAKQWESDLQGVTPQSLSAAAADSSGAKMSRNRAVIFNGLLHGFSWDGAPSLAPAVAVATWRGNLTFLLSYAFGTMAVMAATTTVIGEGTRKAGEILERPDIPQKLSYVSSFVAIFVGIIWMGLALA